MLASSLREEAQATVSNKPGHRGEHEVSRKTIARGMSGDFRCDRGDYARVLHLPFAREASGASSARHSLRPLFCWANGFCKNSGASRREMAELYVKLSNVIARSEATKQSTLQFRGNMDCFASLAMTVPRRATHSAVIARLDQAIQHSTDGCDGIEKPRRAGCPDQAGA